MRSKGDISIQANTIGNPRPTQCSKNREVLGQPNKREVRLRSLESELRHDYRLLLLLSLSL